MRLFRVVEKYLQNLAYPLFQQYRLITLLERKEAMTKKRKPKVERDAHISVEDAITTVGIQLVMWSKLIEDTDPNDSYEPFAQMGEEMLIHSEVLHTALEAFPVLLNVARFQLPSHIGVVTVKNPLVDQKAKEDAHPTDDIPF